MAIGFGIASRNWWRAQIKGGLFPSFSLNFDTIGTDFTFTRNSFATRVNEFGLIETVTDLGSDLVENGSFDELGSEQVTNGDFENGTTDWQNPIYGGNNSATLSIDNGALKVEKNANLDWRSSFVNQTPLTFTSGKTYKITYSLKDGNTSGADVYVRTNFDRSASTVDIKTLTNDWVDYTDYYVADSSADDISFGVLAWQNAGSGQYYFIDNVSVKQVDPNDEWTLDSGWSIANGIGSCDGTSGASIYQNVGGVLGTVYKIEVTISNYISGTLQIGGSSANLEASANGTFTHYRTWTSDSTLYLKSKSGDGFIGSIDNVSVQEVLEDDVPRIDYTTGEAAFLLEPISTNLVTYSEDFTQWSGISATLTNSSSETNPSNINAVGLITGNSGTTSKFATLPISTTSSKHTYSVFLKYNGHQFIQFASGGSTEYGNFDVQNGIVGSGSAGTTLTIESFNNDWYRCILNTSASVTPTNMAIALVDSATSSRLSSTSSVDSVYVWGVQLEALPYATSYIPTSGTTVTRAQETCVDATPTINSEEGVLYVEISALVDNDGIRLISLNNGTSGNIVQLYYSSTASKIICQTKVASSSQSSIQYIASSQTDIHKIAFKYKENDFALWVDGVEIGTDTSGSVWAEGTLNQLDFDIGTGSLPFYGNTKDLKIYDKALTDEELAELTAPPPPEPLLDEYPGASAAYSLRELSAAMEGSAVVRVRRSNDNTEQDFTSTEITDGTLTTFTGANDGFVTTWYDQSGNGVNAVQSTAIEQPKLVSNGVVELDNGKPCIIWDNTNDRMQINTSYSGSNLLSIFSVYNKTTPNPSDDSVYLVYADASLNVPDGVLAWRNIGKIGSYRSGAHSVNGSIPYDTQVNSNFIYTSTQVDFYNNSSLIGSKTSSNAIANFDYTFIQIGRTGGNTSFKNQELIIYQSDQSANRTGIETDINNEYTIY